MGADERDIKIAVLETQFSGLREQHKAHAEAMEKQFSALSEKIDELTAIMNQGKGAYAASMLLAGVIGGAIMAAIEWFRHK